MQKERYEGIDAEYHEIISGVIYIDRHTIDFSWDFCRTASLFIDRKNNHNFMYYV